MRANYGEIREKEELFGLERDIGALLFKKEYTEELLRRFDHCRDNSASPSIESNHEIIKDITLHIKIWNFHCMYKILEKQENNS